MPEGEKEGHSPWTVAYRRTKEFTGGAISIAKDAAGRVSIATCSEDGKSNELSVPQDTLPYVVEFLSECMRELKEGPGNGQSS